MQKYGVSLGDLLEPTRGDEVVYLVSDVDARIAELEKDVARYRWLRADNAYRPEEECIRGGQELDELCDNGLMDRETK